MKNSECDKCGGCRFAAVKYVPGKPAGYKYFLIPRPAEDEYMQAQCIRCGHLVRWTPEEFKSVGWKEDGPPRV